MMIWECIIEYRGCWEKDTPESWRILEEEESVWTRWERKSQWSRCFVKESVRIELTHTVRGCDWVVRFGF